METIYYWIIVIVLIPGLIGAFITRIIDILIRKNLKKEERNRRWYRIEDYEKATERMRWQPFTLGLIERTVFCIYLGTYAIQELSSTEKTNLPNGIFIAALSWITLKLAIGWKTIVGIEVWRRMLAFSAIINSIISISIGLLGGLVLKNRIFQDCFNKILNGNYGLAMFIVTISISCLLIYGIYKCRYGDE